MLVEIIETCRRNEEKKGEGWKIHKGGNFSREGKKRRRRRRRRAEGVVGKSLDSKKCEAYIRGERERERRKGEKEASLLLVFVHVCPSPRIFIASLNLTSKDDPSFPSTGDGIHFHG